MPAPFFCISLFMGEGVFFILLIVVIYFKMYILFELNHLLYNVMVSIYLINVS